MSQRALLAVVGLLLLAGGAASANPAPFADPLEVPAALSEKAASSRLVGVTRAGARLVAVGRLGHILLSEDNGETWRQAATPVSSDLVAVRFVTAEQGWAVGFDGVVLQTVDGGLSWVKKLDGLQAAKLTQAYYQKRAADDPGLHESLVEAERMLTDGADKAFFDVQFLNEREGFIVGAFNQAFRTRDGGASWEPLHDRTENRDGFHLYSLAVADGELYLAGEQGLLRRWNRQKERFEALATPYKGSFFGLIARNEMIIAFGMRGNAFRSDDGGKNWTKLDVGTTWNINGGAILADGRIALVTDGREVLVSPDNGKSFTNVKLEKPMAYYGIAAAAADKVVVVGATGVRLESIK